MPPVSPGAARPARALGRRHPRAAGAGRGRLERLPRQPRAACRMLYEGKVLKDLIPRIYDRPGRVVPAMGAGREAPQADGEHPVRRSRAGSRRPVPPGTPGAEVIDLKAGDAQRHGRRRASPTRPGARRPREAIAAIMQAAPGLAPILAPFWLDELDFPGAKKLAAIAKKTLPPQFQEDEAGSRAAAATAAAAAAGRAGRADDRAPHEGARREDARSSRPTGQGRRAGAGDAARAREQGAHRGGQGAGRAAQGGRLGADGAPAGDARRAGRRPTASRCPGVQRSIAAARAQAFQKDQQAAQQQQSATWRRWPRSRRRRDRRRARRARAAGAAGRTGHGGPRRPARDR